MKNTKMSIADQDYVQETINTISRILSDPKEIKHINAVKKIDPKFGFSLLIDQFPKNLTEQDIFFIAKDHLENQSNLLNKLIVDKRFLGTKDLVRLINSFEYKYLKDNQTIIESLSHNILFYIFSSLFQKEVRCFSRFNEENGELKKTVFGEVFSQKILEIESKDFRSSKEHIKELESLFFGKRKNSSFIIDFQDLKKIIDSRISELLYPCIKQIFYQKYKEYKHKELLVMFKLFIDYRLKNLLFKDKEKNDISDISELDIDLKELYIIYSYKYIFNRSFFARKSFREFNPFDKELSELLNIPHEKLKVEIKNKLLSLDKKEDFIYYINYIFENVLKSNDNFNKYIKKIDLFVLTYYISFVGFSFFEDTDFLFNSINKFNLSIEINLDSLDENFVNKIKEKASSYKGKISGGFIVTIDLDELSLRYIDRTVDYLEDLIGDNSGIFKLSKVEEELVGLFKQIFFLKSEVHKESDELDKDQILKKYAKYIS